jgi:hypothetical protein
MKSLLLILTASFSMTSLAQAADNQCAFGEETWELKEELKSEETGKVWYAGEFVSLDRPERLKGLTKFERELILTTAGADAKDAKQALLDFQSSDGYIQYFHPNADRRFFAMVASYPGDNEFGLIYELEEVSRGNFKVLDVVGVISDSFVEDCKVNKSDIK